MTGAFPGDADGGIPEKEREMIKNVVKGNRETATFLGLTYFLIDDKKRLRFLIECTVEHSSQLVSNFELLEYFRELMKRGSK